MFKHSSVISLLCFSREGWDGTEGMLPPGPAARAVRPGLHLLPGWGDPSAGSGPLLQDASWAGILVPGMEWMEQAGLSVSLSVSPATPGPLVTPRSEVRLCAASSAISPLLCSPLPPDPRQEGLRSGATAAQATLLLFQLRERLTGPSCPTNDISPKKDTGDRDGG